MSDKDVKEKMEKNKCKNPIKQADFVNCKRQMPSGLSVYLKAR